MTMYWQFGILEGAPQILYTLEFRESNGNDMENAVVGGEPGESNRNRCPICKLFCNLGPLNVGGLTEEFLQEFAVLRRAADDKI